MNHSIAFFCRVQAIPFWEEVQRIYRLSWGGRRRRKVLKPAATVPVPQILSSCSENNFSNEESRKGYNYRKVQSIFIYSSAGSLDLRRGLGKCWYGVKLRFWSSFLASQLIWLVMRCREHDSSLEWWEISQGSLQHVCPELLYFLGTLVKGHAGVTVLRVQI